MNNRNDKLFDVILEEALDKYVQDFEENDCDIVSEEKAYMESMKSQIYKNVKRRIIKNSDNKGHMNFKRMLVLIAAAIIILAAAANVSAFRTFVYKTYMDIKGTTLNVSAKKITLEDYNVITHFQPQTEIIVPGWLPSDMRIDTIDENDKYIFIDYYDENMIGFSIRELKLPSESDGGIETENNKVKIENCNVMGMQGKIVYVKSENGNESYSVYWCSDNVQYEIDTNYPRTTLDAILQNLIYLRK